MSNKWIDRYQLLMDNEELNTTQMCFILSQTPNRVRKFRIDLVAKLKLEGINLPNNKIIPTEFFLKEIGKDMKYFENKMIQEAKINKIREESK